MTKIEALQITHDLWEWLEKNPGKKKFDWPNWKHNIGFGSVPNCRNECSCCQYVFEHFSISLGCAVAGDYLKYQTFQIQLALCPMEDLWPKGCSSSDSPYTLWLLNERLDTKYARQIKDHAKSLLTELKHD